VFWAAIGAGTLLIVGSTELAGGTTAGYRLFMAWLVAVLAAVLVASELALPDGVVAGSTAELRRPLVIGFAAGSVAYLAASLARWRPRALVAVGAGLIGLAALGTLAAAGGTRSPTLFGAQLLLCALALGTVNAAMLLGHWYLVTPRLSPAPLRRMMWVLLAALAVQAVVSTTAILTLGAGELEGGIGWLAWLRLAAGALLPVAVTVLALLASRAASLQASTGLLYIGLALVMAGSIAGTSISYITGVPV
jgi:hypothetical protein